MNESSATPKACVIWLHGLGADASDMAGLAQQLPLSGLELRHVFLDAPLRPVTLNNGMTMRAWYDITGMTLTDREDKAGIENSESAIRELIEAQKRDGFSSGQIFLAGFSQGGAMALYTALQFEEPLAGVISLSAYLPLRASIVLRQAKALPLFMAGGRFDPVVLPQWTHASKDWIIAQGFKHLQWQEYDMEHSVCMEELRDIAYWIKQQPVLEGL